MEKMWENFAASLGDSLLDLGCRILFVVICWLVGVQLIKFVRKAVHRGMERANADVGVVQFVDSFLKASLYVVMGFMVAGAFGVDAASIVALLGSAGVAIGLAVQGSLSNLAGGVLILLLKPFKVGDYIIESSTGKEGTVEEIQIFYTKLITMDNQVVILPNGNLANNSIVNVTAKDCRRLDLTVGIAYDADIRKTKEILQKLAKNSSKVLQEKGISVFVDELADSCVKMRLLCYLHNDDYWQEKWRLTEEVKYALDEAGITIAFPQLDVHVNKIHDPKMHEHKIYSK